MFPIIYVGLGALVHIAAYGPDYTGMWSVALVTLWPAFSLWWACTSLALIGVLFVTKGIPQIAADPMMVIRPIALLGGLIVLAVVGSWAVKWFDRATDRVVEAAGHGISGLLGRIFRPRRS